MVARCIVKPAWALPAAAWLAAVGARPADLAVDLLARERKIRLVLETAFSGRGEFRIWIPPAFPQDAGWRAELRSGSQGGRLESRLVHVGRASYLETACDLVPGRHTLVLASKEQEEQQEHEEGR